MISNADVRTQLSQTPTITHATHPNLRLLCLEGVSAFIAAFICQIPTPRLEWLSILLDFRSTHVFHPMSRPVYGQQEAQV